VGQNPAGEGAALDADRPGAVRAQVGVEGEATGEKGQEMFVVSVVFEDSPPADVRAGGVAGPDLASGERVSVECGTKAGGEPVDAIAFRRAGLGPGSSVCPGRHLDSYS
jgi:hypothetical protein